MSRHQIFCSIYLDVPVARLTGPLLNAMRERTALQLPPENTPPDIQETAAITDALICLLLHAKAQNETVDMIAPLLNALGIISIAENMPEEEAPILFAESFAYAAKNLAHIRGFIEDAERKMAAQVADKEFSS